MVNIPLTPKAFDAVKLLQKEGVNVGSLVSELIVAYTEMPHGERDALCPRFVCSDCSHTYFSKESLDWHHKKTHQAKAEA